ncbi:MAG: alanine racemase [Alphaproteobacteria bacterium]|nr:alanine racemase [Alphaproteobacteria bacterium]
MSGLGQADLLIDLAALVANWRRIADMVAPAETAGVVKANGYGLGAAEVARALSAAGCRTFFVAHPAEALALRPLLPADRAIFVLHGAPKGAGAALAGAGIVPVLNTLAEIEAFAALGRARGGLPAAIQIDTGMTRLGLRQGEVEAIAARPGLLDGIELRLVMSHLACADERAHPMNARQQAGFEHLRRLLPPAPASLANSAGCFLGREFHLDLVRPGIALYGGRVLADGPNTMREVVRIVARILQVHAIDTPRTVGYGASHSMPAGGRIATVAVGYADGYPRALGNRGFAVIDGFRVPVVGRVSMDLLTLDVSALPSQSIRVGQDVHILGGGVPADELAALAGTIDYELFTRLGARYRRTYLGPAA